MVYTPYEEKKYVPGDAVTKAQQALARQQAAKPGQYQSQFQTGMKGLMQEIQARPKFQYDPDSDALYQQAVQSYIQQGRTAMLDTLGRSAALTGGYGNSYAQTAGQQQYNQHLLGLAQLVPQYQQMALQRYQAEGDDLLSRYELLARQEEAAYGRYQDDVTRYYAELDRLQGAYDSERDYDYSRFADDRDFDYGAYLDALEREYQLDRDRIADEQWAQQLQYQQERDSIKDQQWQAEFDEDLRRYNQEWAAQQAAAAAKASGGSGGRRASGDREEIDVEAEYLAMKKSGANARDTDGFLRAAISAGLISQKAATELRQKRY